jgi:CDP-diacylglycerol---glycerol-3-phosphate 3-phosphatidyltransferase
MTESAKTDPSFTEVMRGQASNVLQPIARALLRAGLSANSVTLIGLMGNAAGGVLLAMGYIQWGGVLMLISVPLDALDGTMARISGSTSSAGAFLDSVTDRWSEIFLFGGLAVWSLQTTAPWMSLLSFAAVCGSLMVSYTKARAEGLGFPCNVGLLTRLERYLVMLPALLFNLPWIGAGLIAVLATATAIQRMGYVLRLPQPPAGSALIGSKKS